MLMRMPGPWHVVVTRDEGHDGPLSQALRAVGLRVVHCRLQQEQAPMHMPPLIAAARALDQYDWAIFSSRRAVSAIAAALSSPWPRGLRTAAVGGSTAGAIVAAGADPDSVVATESGADALWTTLKNADTWAGKRVLVPAVAGGRQTVIDGLIRAGATVDVIEAYRMLPRPAAEISSEWHASAPDAVIIASPSAGSILINAVGRDALATLAAVVAIGPTTAAALVARGLTPDVAPKADFVAIANYIADLQDTGRSHPVRPTDG